MVAEETKLKRKVHEAEQEKERIIRGQEAASQAIQDHVDVQRPSPHGYNPIPTLDRPQLRKLSLMPCAVSKNGGTQDAS